jgi:hypothetical protein
MVWSWFAIWVLNVAAGVVNQGSADVNNIPQWLSDPTTAVDLAASKIAPFASLLPVGLMVELLYVGICIILPVVVGILVVEFIWNHAPSIAGFGT